MFHAQRGCGVSHRKTSQRAMQHKNWQFSHFAPSARRVACDRDCGVKDVDVDIPRDALVVFTGVSGSGKSSLAFSTLFAEAQRRYLESIAPYARRLFHHGCARSR